MWRIYKKYLRIFGFRNNEEINRIEHFKLENNVVYRLRLKGNI